MRIATGAFVVSLVLAWGGIASAQNTISEADFKERETAAYAKLKTISYRMERVTEHYDDLEKPVSQKSKVIELHVPPGSSHVIVQREQAGSVTTSETISIAGKRYVRESGKTWVSGNPESGSGGGRGYGRWGDPDVHPRVETTVVDKGKDNVNGLSADLIVLTRRYIFPNKISTIVEKVWFDPQGRVLRDLTESDGGRPNRFLQRTDTVYTYDPSIRIEAPIK